MDEGLNNVLPRQNTGTFSLLVFLLSSLPVIAVPADHAASLAAPMPTKHRLRFVLLTPCPLVAHTGTPEAHPPLPQGNGL